jgi:signal peptidase I
MKQKTALSAKQLAYLGTAAAIAFYVITQNAVFALATFALLVFVFYEEFFTQKNALKEMISSIAFALGAWLLLSFLLNTSSPINVVTSCSMLPDLERGDLIILKGEGDYNTQATQFDENLSRVQYSPYSLGNGQSSAKIILPTANGNPVFQPAVKTCTRSRGGQTYQVACLDYASIANAKSYPSKANDVLVFESDTAAGLIIHRSLAKINAKDGEYYLTKGDNNQFPDQISGFPLIKRQEMRQVLFNIPILGVVGLDKNNDVIYAKENDVKIKGKVLLRIPYVGYAKLFLFLQFATPAGCDMVFV